MSRKISKQEKARRMAERGNWSLDFARCWVCGNEGRGIMALQIHEMERRSQAPSHHWADPCNYFKTCDTCHMDLLAAMPSNWPTNTFMIRITLIWRGGCA